MTIEARLTFATKLILEAGQLAARHFAHREDLTRETKGPQDFVSIADREVESLIRTRLTEAFPADGFLGEESGGETVERCWIVDPIVPFRIRPGHKRARRSRRLCRDGAVPGYSSTCPSIDRVWSGAKSRTDACTCLPAGSCRPVHRDDTSVRLITSLKGSRAEDNDPWLFAVPSLGRSFYFG